MPNHRRAAEWLAASLLISPQFRLLGCCLGTIVLLGVIGTLLRDRQLVRLEYPLVLFALALLVASSAAEVSTP